MSQTQDPSQSTPHYGPSPSSNLYLFTFLATLVLLLMISSFIVLRSYVLRRRYQRRVDQALAAGIILTPRAQGSRKKRFGLRPKFHQVWIMPGHNAQWEYIMPVSVHSLSNRKSRRPPNQPPAIDPPPSSLLRLWSLSTHSRQPQRPPAQPTQRIEPKRLQVSVLVAMPSPRRPRNLSTASLTNGGAKSYDGDADDDELPDFDIGVAELPYISKTKKAETIVTS